jgi:hypothetical protein
MNSCADFASPASTGVAGSGGLAGLVSSKTSGNDALISFHSQDVAARRVKRLKKSVWASGHLHGISQNGHRALVCWFVTLTYERCGDWQPRHVSEALRSYRRYCKRIDVPCRYTWVAELQSRGAVHYHLLCWLPHGVDMPFWDKDYSALGALRRFKCSGKGWSAFWPHGSCNTQVARGGVGYLMKYLSKLGELTVFPKGLRLYGIGGLNEVSRSVRSWINFPEWVKPYAGVGGLSRVSGGFMVRQTGELLRCPYEVLRVSGGLVLRAVGQLAEKFHSGPYSSVSFA